MFHLPSPALGGPLGGGPRGGGRPMETVSKKLRGLIFQRQEQLFWLPGVLIDGKRNNGNQVEERCVCYSPQNCV